MRAILFAGLLASFAFASLHNLSLQEAIDLVKKRNSAVKIAKLKEEMAAFDTKIAKSYNFGNLDVTLNALRSNDAGNVFGFKLQSREAKFADFGFDQFLAPMGEVLEQMNAHPGGLPQGFTKNMGSILQIEPTKLNYPEARNHFQTLLTYKLPLFTGYKLSMYEQISKAMKKMSHLDAKKILSEQIYQTKKTFFDIVLVDEYISNLKVLQNHMEKLEDIIKNFKAEGYAKETDVLEVEAKKYDVLSYLNQAKLNRKLAYEYLSFLVGEEVASIKKPKMDIKMVATDTARLVHNSFDFEKVALARHIAAMNIRLKKSGYYPMVGAFGQYGSSDNRPFNDFFDKDFYTVGAQLKWNLFVGGRTRDEVQKAKIKRLQVEEQYNLAKRGLALKINQLKTAIKSKEYDIKAQSAHYKLAQKIYDMYVQKYKEGLAKISDVLIKHSEEIQVLLKLLKTKTERMEKIFELESLLDKESR